MIGPRNSRIASAIFLTLLAASVRLWYFQRTVGQFEGVGIEDVYRLLIITTVKPEGAPLFPPNVGPFQKMVGTAFLTLFPNTPYVTRWISLATGILAPAVLFFLLLPEGLLIAWCAGLALALSSALILFSTYGLAEPLSFFLIFLFLLAFGRALGDETHGRVGNRTYVMIVLGGLLAGCASLTRFEVWTVLPAVFLLSLFSFSPKRSLLWAVMFIAPIAWLDYCRTHYGSYLVSSQLITEASLKMKVIGVKLILDDVFPALKTPLFLSGHRLFDYGSGFRTIVLAFSLAVIGWLYSLFKTRLRPLAFSAVSMTAFILLMVRLGKAMPDKKYAMTMEIWADVLMGIGVAAAAAGAAKIASAIIARCMVKETMTGKVEPSTETSGRKLIRRLSTFAAATLTIVLLSTAQISQSMSENLPLENTSLFTSAKSFLPHLEKIASETNAPDQKVVLVAKKEFSNYLLLNSKPIVKGKILSCLMDSPPRVSEVLPRIIPVCAPRLPGGYLITQLAENEPREGVKKACLEYGYRCEFIEESDSFQIYSTKLMSE